MSSASPRQEAKKHLQSCFLIVTESNAGARWRREPEVRAAPSEGETAVREGRGKRLQREHGSARRDGCYATACMESAREGRSNTMVNVSAANAGLNPKPVVGPR